MKLIQYALLVLLTAVYSTSCGENEEGSSTPVDSTNVHGTAPATYGPGDPASPDSPVYEGSFDTGMRANTMSREDSLRMAK